jgi:hypothetical protein
MKRPLSVIILLIILVSCRFHPEMDQADSFKAAGEVPANEWTVILYLGMDNIQFGTFPTDLWGLTDNLLAGGSALARPDYPIIILYDGQDAGDSIIINLKDRSLVDDGGVVIDSDTPEVNYGDPGTMSSFIIWAAEKYPARHYLLGLCHHYGWKGYNTDESSEGPLGMDIITMPEHAESMQEVREAGIHMDIIWFEACSINMLETLYQYAQDVEFIVGGEDTIDFFELVTRPFRVLAAIRKHPRMSPQDLAGALVEKTPVITPSLVVNQFTPYSFALNPGSPGESAELGRLCDLWLPTQYAFSGSGIRDVAKDLDGLAALLIEHLSDERENIISARRKAKEYSLSPWYCDLWDFAELLKKRTSNSDIKSACENLKLSIDHAVVAEKRIFLDQHHHGILIQFPVSRAEYERHIENEFDQGNSYADLAFANDTMWDEFMAEVWKD